MANQVSAQYTADPAEDADRWSRKPWYDGMSHPKHEVKTTTLCWVQCRCSVCGRDNNQLLHQGPGLKSSLLSSAEI